MFFYFTFF